LELTVIKCDNIHITLLTSYSIATLQRFWYAWKYFSLSFQYPSNFAPNVFKTTKMRPYQEDFCFGNVLDVSENPLVGPKRHSFLKVNFQKLQIEYLGDPVF